MHTSVVNVTPQMAEKWLASNVGNRRLRPGMVSRYAHDMANGDWDDNGESIKVATTGVILDGQHRLHAVVESGRTIRMVVVEGIAPEAFRSIDTGQPRSTSDVLQRMGESNPNDLASALALLWKWRTGYAHWTGGGMKLTPSRADLVRLLDEHPGLRVSLPWGQRVQRAVKMRRTLGAVCHYTFGSVDDVDAPTDADAFFERLADGAGMDEDDPIWRLREFLLHANGPHKRVHGPTEWAVTIKAWNSFRRGEKVKTLRFRTGGASPEAFPVPE